MKLLFSALTAALLLLIPTVHAINRTWLNSQLAVLNNQQVAEFYNMVLNFIEMIDRNSINTLNYALYFNQELRDESNYVLARIRGYASDATQAVEWERAAAQTFRALVVHWCANHAHAIYNSFVALCRPETPSSLLTQCIRSVSGYYFKDFYISSYFPPINSPILLYELKRFAAIPIYVFSTNTVPYLRLGMIDDSCRRFIHESTNRTDLPNTFGFLNFINYSPHNNYANELKILWHAQKALNQYWNELAVNFYHSTFKSGFLDDSVNSKLQEIARKCSRQMMSELPRAELRQHQVISVAFLDIMTRFLFNEFNWLACHPVNYFITRTANSNNERIESFMRQNQRLHSAILITAETFTTCVENTLVPHDMTEAILKLEYHLSTHGYKVGYSLRRASGIAIVLNDDVAKPQDEIDYDYSTVKPKTTTSPAAIVQFNNELPSS